MKVAIQTLGFDTDEKFDAFLHEHLVNLVQDKERFFRADVIFYEGAKNVPGNKFCEIRLSGTSRDYWSKKHADSFERSFMKAIDGLRSQFERVDERRT